MDRFIVKEPRVGAGFPQGNQMMTYPANTRSGSMVPPETLYSRDYLPDFHQVQDTGMNLHYLGQNQQNMNSIHLEQNQQNMNLIRLGQNQPIMNSIPVEQNQQRMNLSHSGQNQQNMNSTHLGQNQQIIISSHFGQNQQSMNSAHFGQNQQSMNSAHFGQNQQGMNSPHFDQNQKSINSSHLGQNQQNMDSLQMGQTQAFGTGPTMTQGHLSGIDHRYLSEYGDSSSQYIQAGQQLQRNQPPISSFGNDYQNTSFKGVDRMQPKNIQPTISKQPQVVNLGDLEKAKIEEISEPPTSAEAKNTQKQLTFERNFPPKKPSELDLIKNDCQNRMARADKLKALHISGPRAFSGSVEKVLKWHKTLQDIGILIIYEVVDTAQKFHPVYVDETISETVLPKCVSVRPGENCAKNLVIRDDNGPAMQVVYYEIDFLLPELKPPCTVRVVGRMIAGTSRLQAFNVRPATGDDVAILPRRAAVATHHISKLSNEFGHN